MNEVGDNIRQKEDELEALRQNLESTPPDDKAYVSASNFVKLSLALIWEPFYFGTLSRDL